MLPLGLPSLCERVPITAAKPGAGPLLQNPAGSTAYAVGLQKRGVRYG